MKNNKNVRDNNQKYEQVSQNDDKSEIIIFQTNKKISVSCFSLIRVVSRDSLIFGTFSIVPNPVITLIQQPAYDFKGHLSMNHQCDVRKKILCVEHE